MEEDPEACRKAIGEALDAHETGADAMEVLAWLKAWAEGAAPDRFDDWDGELRAPERSVRPPLAASGAKGTPRG